MRCRCPCCTAPLLGVELCRLTFLQQRSRHHRKQAELQEQKVRSRFIGIWAPYPFGGEEKNHPESDQKFLPAWGI